MIKYVTILILDLIDILDFENLNLEDIVTPVKVKVYEKLLNEAGYDKQKTRFLVNGFSKGTFFVIKEEQG